MIKRLFKLFLITLAVLQLSGCDELLKLAGTLGEPVPGNNGIVNVNSITDGGFSLSWTEAEYDGDADDVSYSIYVVEGSTYNASIQSDQEPVGYGYDINSYEVTGLEPGTTYSYAVVVSGPEEIPTAYETDNVTTVISSTDGNGDSYEFDDSATQADLFNRTISVDEIQFHTIDVAGDEDWMSFNAVEGYTYEFYTFAANTYPDTYMELYGVDGTTLLSSNDDFGSGYYSSISYSFAASGTYYIMVRELSSSEYDVDYNVSVELISDDPTIGGINVIID